MGLRVIVTGGRDYQNPSRVFKVLDEIHRTEGIRVVVHGACPRGVDTYAHLWAMKNQVHIEPHPGEWNKYGKGAGHKRNRLMAQLGADLCVVFPGGRGTQNMLGNAIEHNIPYRIVSDE